MARPAEFDRDEVLEKAMETFWRTGYTGTSVTDLVKATNLKPGSLYGAFTSKRGLFLEVIDTYAARNLRRIQSCIEDTGQPLDAIHLFFDRFCTELVRDEIGKGCLMINTMLELATEDDEIRLRITGYLNRVETYFVDALRRAQQSGQLATDRTPESIAKFLMTGIWGLRVLSSTRPAPTAYGDVISNLLAVLQPPRR